MRSRPSVAGWDGVSRLRSPGVGQVYRWAGAAGLAGPPAAPLGGLQPGQPLREGSALRESSGRRAFRVAAQKFAGCVRVNFECARVPLLFPATRSARCGSAPQAPGLAGPSSEGGRAGGKFIVDSPLSGFGEVVS